MCVLQVTKKLMLACSLSASFMVIEVIGGFFAGRYALHPSLAGHILLCHLSVCLHTGREHLCLAAMWCAQGAAAIARPWGVIACHVNMQRSSRAAHFACHTAALLVPAVRTQRTYIAGGRIYTTSGCHAASRSWRTQRTCSQTSSILSSPPTAPIWCPRRPP